MFTPGGFLIATNINLLGDFVRSSVKTIAYAAWQPPKRTKIIHHLNFSRKKRQKMKFILKAFNVLFMFMVIYTYLMGFEFCQPPIMHLFCFFLL